MLNKLTDTKCKAFAAKPAADKPERIADGGGLALAKDKRRQPWWRFDYRFGGKQKTLSFGIYPEVSLAEARDHRTDAKRLIRVGKDPSAERQEEKKKAEPPKQGPTWKDACEGYKALINRNPRSDKTKDRDERMIAYLVRAFGDKPVEDVRAQDLVKLLNTFEAAGSYETRMRLQATAQHIGGYAHVQHDLPGNPFLGFAFGKAFTAPKDKPRPAIIEPEEFGKLLRNMAAYSGRMQNLVGTALNLLALTFVRPGTVCAAEWAEFDLDAAMWTIPFAKLKQRSFREGIKELNGKSHQVPLPRQAVAILRDLQELTGRGKYLFPSRNDRPISTNALELALKAMGYKDVHCPHGFRSSASTLLNKERVIIEGKKTPRFDKDAIEFQLEHVDASMAAKYDRDDLIDERTEIMQFWADKVDTLRNPPQPKEELPNNVHRLRA